MPSLNSNRRLSPARPLPSALQQLQRHLLQADLSLSWQHAVFMQYAPPVVFLSIFIFGTLLPRYIDLDSEKWHSPGTAISEDLFPGFQELCLACQFMVSGVVITLATLRTVIWIGARLVEAFCDLDLGPLQSIRVKPVGDGPNQMKEGKTYYGQEIDEFELSQRNLILGGFSGT